MGIAEKLGAEIRKCPCKKYHEVIPEDRKSIGHEGHSAYCDCGHPKECHWFGGKCSVTEIIPIKQKVK